MRTAIASVLFLVVGCEDEGGGGDELVGGEGKPSIALTQVPPLGSHASLEGQVAHVRPNDFRVAVFINVGGWWNKPTWDNPLTKIQSDGGWSCDITTGGNDANAAQVAAFLVTSGYSPPQLNGAAALPSELGRNAAAKTQASR